MPEVDDQPEQQVLSYSAFLNRQLLQAWRERLRVHQAPAKKNQIVGLALRASRLWPKTPRPKRSS